MSAFLGEQAENCRRSTPKIRYVLTGAGVSFTKPPSERQAKGIESPTSADAALVTKENAERHRGRQVKLALRAYVPRGQCPRGGLMI